MLTLRQSNNSPRPDARQVRPEISRRGLAGIGVAVATTIAAGAWSENGAMARRCPLAPPVALTPGRLLARPAPPTEPIAPGLHRLNLAPRRDALLRIPAGYRAERPAPFALILHGAGGDAERGLEPLEHLADEAGLVLLAPASRGPTWDVVRGGFGPDVAFVDRALATAFARVAVDPALLAIAGFSDGASYALSLGIGNGDLFGHIMAFSPGFAAPADLVGEPRIFVSHGVADEVLPIDQTSRLGVPVLRRAGYDVTYVEFDGGHTVPSEIAQRALAWFLRGSAPPAERPLPGTPAAG